MPTFMTNRLNEHRVQAGSACVVRSIFFKFCDPAFLRIQKVWTQNKSVQAHEE